MIKDKELKLLLYKETPIIDGITFIQPSIKDIIDVGYYDFMMSIYLFFNPKDLLIEAKELYDFFEDKDMDEYETLSYLLDSDEDCRELVGRFIGYHFKENFKIKDGKIMFGSTVMNKELYAEICEIIVVCYGLEERLSDKNFANKIAMTMMVNLIRNRRKQAKRHNVDKDIKKSPLLSVISIVRTRKNDREILEMSNYQLIDFYRTINREKQYEAALNGVYTGAVKSDKVNKIWTGED
jgi:hypothetical protein